MLASFAWRGFPEAIFLSLCSPEARPRPAVCPAMSRRLLPPASGAVVLDAALAHLALFTPGEQEEAITRLQPPARPSLRESAAGVGVLLA